jgi:hypothetical protein
MDKQGRVLQVGMAAEAVAQVAHQHPMHWALCGSRRARLGAGGGGGGGPVCPQPPPPPPPSLQCPAPAEVGGPCARAAGRPRRHQQPGDRRAGCLGRRELQGTAGHEACGTLARAGH